MSPQARRKDLTLGILLLIAGAGLFLYTLNVVPLDLLAGSVWLALAAAGTVAVLHGWSARSSILLFVGGFLLVAGTHTALWSFGILQPEGEEVLAAIFLWIGLASVFVWLPEPHKIDLLVPAFLFGGCGLGYYLWWWDVMRMSELKDIYANGWPVFLILLGAGILLRSLRSTRGRTG